MKTFSNLSFPHFYVHSMRKTGFLIDMSYFNVHLIISERRRVRLQRSLTRYTPGPGDMVSRSETRFDRLQRINTGPV